MAVKDCNHRDHCPFWSALSMKCKISKGGLFIPLDDHAEVYCKSPDFPQCLQYSLHPKQPLELIDNIRQNDRNRRKFTRVKASYKITLVRHIHSGEVVSHFSTIATTLDLSSSGMRLTTDKPLINDSVIQFVFNDFFPENLQEGTGQVAWCSKEIDSPYYQAGISFQDDQLIKAMGSYLNLHCHDM
ncbi:MAG: PilZ domain-containing protein [Desulfobulbaceae bacterium]|nr:PilZ domain-containing protein [Desulfobulbaceae bacterium]